MSMRALPGSGSVNAGGAGARRAAWRLGVALPLLLACCGCPFSPPTDSSNLPFIDEEDNAAFNRATALPLAPADELSFAGEISAEGDLDLFALGTLAPGDQVFIDVRPDEESLDLVAAVFDSRQYLHAYNDDRAADSSNLNPLIDFVLQGEMDEYVLGITTYAGSAGTGRYRVTVRITRGAGITPPTGQIVFLDWDGGQNLVVENVGEFDLRPFDAADLGPYGGRSAEMKDRIQEIVAERYAGYNLVVRNSDDHPVPTEPHTTVYFGSRDARAFAISQQIDQYNKDRLDNTIVFTESFAGAFHFTPTFEQMAMAVGNTVAHELGHLLGLVHTSDCDSLMDSSCLNERLLAPQEFITAVLSEDVFPVGLQPAREVLEWVLGLVGM